MSEAKQRDWRNINVRRNRKHEVVVDRLCSRKNSYTGKPIFEFNKDLMVFAAVLGFSENVKEPLESDAIQITLGTYASDEKDGFIYLLALLESRSPEVLKDEKIDEAVKVFENYCNGGLSLVSQWFMDNPGDVEGSDTLVDKIFERLILVDGQSDPEKNKRNVDF